MAFTWNRSSTNVDLQSTGVPAVADGGSSADDAERTKVGDLIVGFEKYLRDNAETHLTLFPAITELRAAVAAFRSDQIPDSAAAIRRVLATILAARQGDPSIPQP